MTANYPRLWAAIALLLLAMSLASCEHGYFVLGTSPPVLNKWINIVGLNEHQALQMYNHISHYLDKQHFKAQPPTEADCRNYSGQTSPCYVRNFSWLEKGGARKVGVFLFIDAHRQKVGIAVQETEADSPVPEGPLAFSSEACDAIENLADYVVSLAGMDQLTYGYNGIASESEPGLTLQKYIGCK